VASVSYRTVEFHRFGSPEELLKPDNRYIRTAGWDARAVIVSPGLEYDDFQRSLNALRYGPLATDSDIISARNRLAAEAVRFLGGVEPAAGELLQVDLVTNAAELWAFPFEACFLDRQTWLKDGDSGVVVTRRIRGDFSDTATPWPVTPRVLFVHAPAAADLSAELIEQHVRALENALAPWARGKDVGSPLLTVCQAESAEDLEKWRTQCAPSYVHVLAHGALAPGDPLLPDKKIWGLRLGGVNEPGVSPSDVADALQPSDGLPLVVTIAACDSGNQGNPVYGARSVVQELHRCGVPVVVGSQLPLTKDGSVTLTQSFYHRLLRGDDVRVALHAARLAVKADPKAAHDWLSIVGYVRLPPEGYAAYLEEIGLRIELRLLDAAQARADLLTASGGGTIEDFADIETQLLTRLESLNARRSGAKGRKEFLEECCGLEASAYKRLAELRFEHGLRHPAARTAAWQSARDALDKALAAYRAAYQADLNSHWLGIQQLALDVVLHGTVARPDDWTVVRSAAEIARDRPAHDGDVQDYWSCGTLAELALIAPRANQPRNLEMASKAAGALVSRARQAKDEFAIESTRRQMRRYVRWWTTGNGFFPGSEDLAQDATDLLRILT
jgi:hypothetical protein